MSHSKMIFYYVNDHILCLQMHHVFIYDLLYCISFLINRGIIIIDSTVGVEKIRPYTAEVRNCLLKEIGFEVGIRFAEIIASSW